MEQNRKPAVAAFETTYMNFPCTYLGRATDTTDVEGDPIKEKWYYWHCKLGHLEEEALKKLTIDSVGFKLEIPEKSSFEDCAVCQQLPSVNVEEVITKRQSDRPLKLLHVYVSKPDLPDGNENKPYLLVIVDDYTNYCDVNLCQDAIDMLTYLEDFIDDGKELFVLNPDVVQLEGSICDFYHLLSAWLKERNIGLTTTVRKTRRAYSKGAELLNILMRKAKALLSDSPYKNFYAGESIQAGAHLFNITTMVDNITPYEHWYGQRPTLFKIKRFGTYVLSSNQDRVRYIYLGIEDNVHKILEPKSRNIHFFANVLALDKKDTQNRVEAKLGLPVEPYPGRERKYRAAKGMVWRHLTPWERTERKMYSNTAKKYREKAYLQFSVFEKTVYRPKRGEPKRPPMRRFMNKRDQYRVDQYVWRRMARAQVRAYSEKMQSVFGPNTEFSVAFL